MCHFGRMCDTLFVLLIAEEYLNTLLWGRAELGLRTRDWKKLQCKPWLGVFYLVVLESLGLYMCGPRSFRSLIIGIIGT